MTSTTVFAMCVGGTTGLAATLVAQQADPSPWWVGALVGVAGFVALIVKWMMTRQDQMHAEARDANAKREDFRNTIDEARLRQIGEQTAALSEITATLRMHSTEFRDLPKRTADEVGQRLLEQGFRRP